MNERTFSIHDLGRVFLKYKTLISLVCVLCACGGFFYAVSQPVEYLVEASFKEQAEIRVEGPLQGLREALGGALDSSHTPFLMKSQQILIPIIVQQGLQIVQEDEKPFSVHVRECIRAERGRKLQERALFRFQNVTYLGEKPLHIAIQRISDDAFEVCWKDQTVSGCLGEEIAIGGLLFTLHSFPKGMKQGSSSHFSVRPLDAVLHDLRDRLSISGHKQNRSILLLKLRYPNRFLGAEILNTLMVAYPQFLQKEHEQRLDQELLFLCQRQEELNQGFDHVLTEQKEYLQRNAETLGLVDLKQEQEDAGTRYRECCSKLRALEQEEQYLAAWDQRSSPFSLQNSSVGSPLNALYGMCEELSREQDLTEQAFYTGTVPFHKDEALFRVRSDLRALEGAEEVFVCKGGDGLESLSLFCDPDKLVCTWIEAVRQGVGEREDVSLYLKNLAHHLSIQERCLLGCSVEKQEWEGADLDTIRRVIGETGHALEGVRSTKEQLSHLLHQIKNPSFDLSSLSSFLHDAVSQRGISLAVQSHALLEERELYSEKERERAERALALQRNLLKGHLARLLETEELRDQLLQEKIATLQSMRLEAIHRRRAVYQEQMADLVRQRMAAVNRERDVLKKTREVLKRQIEGLPEKWFLEHWMNLKIDTASKLIQTVHQVLETKVIGRHLYHVGSSALDKACPPRMAQKPLLGLCACLGAVAGFVPTYVILFIIAFLRGLPTGLDTLRALKLPCSGFIGGSREEDQETLAKALLELAEHEEIVLILGEGPDYRALLTQTDSKKKMFCSAAALHRAEALSLLTNNRGVIVTVCGESLDVLTPYINHPHCVFIQKRRTGWRFLR